MKSERLRRVIVNNHAKQLTITYCSGKTINIHYGQVGIDKNITKAWLDKETDSHAIGFEYVDGTQDFMPYDQPLAVAKDPEFLLRNQIEVITATIRRELQRRNISLRFLARELGTSDNQIQRLLNPNILQKNLTQLSKIAALLNLEVELRIKAAA